MHRFRRKRKRIAALALLPVAALTAASSITYVTAATVAPATGVEFKLGERHVRAGERVKLTGKVAPGGQHPVVIEVNGRKVAKTTSGSMGQFHAKWRAGGPGVYKLVAKVTDGSAPISSHARTLNSYRAVQASYYGPAFTAGTWPAAAR